MRIRITVVLFVLGLITRSLSGQEVRVLSRMQPETPSKLYISNRTPLTVSPFIKLPIGSIRPKGWLRHQLELQRDGMVGHLPELSRWTRMEGNAWADAEGRGHSGWEEMPYWLKGYGDLGYVLKDEKIIAETRKWIEAILRTQREDGWFGPRELLTSIRARNEGPEKGKPDLWPNMLVLNILQSHHEVTADPRIVPFMTRYFRWQLAVPDDDFMAGYWPKMRAGDNLESVYWLYNRTGESWLLDLAEKIHRACARWDEDVINWHGVNITQGFREPTIYWMQSKDPKHLEGAERNYQKVMNLYGQVPGGMFGADENARPGYSDPRQAAETCSMVEFMHSFEMLTKITGQPRWADRCEDVAFNSLPAALTPDHKALHYLTGANMVQLDSKNKAPGIQNGGCMLAYSPFEKYRCCQHNVAHGWPYYAEHLWLATADHGLLANLYAECTVKAKVADGREVEVVTSTDYPFSDEIRIKVATEKPVSFPLYLRIPAWCNKPEIVLGTDHQRRLDVDAKAESYVVIDRQWSDMDVVILKLPRTLRLHTFEKNKNAVAIDYGPLTFSLKIGQRWQRFGGTDQWPEHELYPTTPWNYGLVLDETNPASSFEILPKPGQLPPNPFTPETTPIEIRAKGRRIPQWTLDGNGLLNPLQPSPAKTTERVEEITLIPMGAARLRISAFPVASDAPNARQWTAPLKPPTASHTWTTDTTTALNDRVLPNHSNDPSIPRFTWWPRKGSEEWVRYDFEKPRELSAAEVYWFDDAPGGGCRTPAEWRLEYRVGDEWKPISPKQAYGVEKDRFNRVEFERIEASGLRLVARLRDGFSAGILEWRIE